MGKLCFKKPNPKHEHILKIATNIVSVLFENPDFFPHLLLH